MNNTHIRNFLSEKFGDAVMSQVARVELAPLVDGRFEVVVTTIAKRGVGFGGSAFDAALQAAANAGLKQKHKPEQGA